MKVIAINGSPRADGNTFLALSSVMQVLEEQDIQVEIVHLGNAKSCTGCYTCARTRDCTCALTDDGVNECIIKIKEADGVLIGAPVYYAGISGTMKGVLDRIFTVCGNNGNLLRHKVGAPVVVVRRIGALPAFDAILHYLTYAEMVIPGSNNWNTAYGRAPGEVNQDFEGIQTMQILGRNMAWLLKLISYGKDALPAPERTKKIYTNFIR